MNFMNSQGPTCNFDTRKCLPELKISAQLLAQERKGKQSVQKRSRYISTVDIQHSTSSSTRNVRITQNIHAFSWGYVVKKNLDDIAPVKAEASQFTSSGYLWFMITIMVPCHC